MRAKSSSSISPCSSQSGVTGGISTIARSKISEVITWTKDRAKEGEIKSRKIDSDADASLFQAIRRGCESTPRVSYDAGVNGAHFVIDPRETGFVRLDL